MDKILRTKIYLVVFGFAVISLILNFIMQRHIAREDFYNNSHAVFSDIEFMIENNNAVIDTVKQDFTETCRLRARIAATYIEHDRSIIHSSEKAQELAKLLNVDEIHIFDKEGTIIGGSLPSSYGLTVYSGEQIGFFKDMLNNTNVELAQDLQPKTYDGNKIQFAAAWMPCKEYFVQVGREARWLEKVLERTELSNVFNNIVLDKHAQIFAIDIKTNEIIASMNPIMNDRHISDYDFNDKDIKMAEDGMGYVTKNDEEYFLVIDDAVINDNLKLGMFIKQVDLYDHVRLNTAIVLFYLFMVALCVVEFISYFLKKYVTDDIKKINNGLTEITNGNLNTKLNVSTTPEFKELSKHINVMVESLKGNTRRAFEMCNKLNLPVGLFEYRNEMDNVSITGNLAEIIALKAKEIETVFANKDIFKEKINRIRENLVDKDHVVYKIPWADKYIRFNQEVYSDATIGIAVDVTNNYKEISAIVRERDTDVLTGLYNRRSFFEKMEELFERPEEIGIAGMFFVDANKLKFINDTYGHNVGDEYICSIADIIRNWEGKGKIYCRYGGDEFVVFVYGAESKEELLKAFDKTIEAMENTSVECNGKRISLSFAVGAAFYPENDDDYHALLTLADVNMYKNKRVSEYKRTV